MKKAETYSSIYAKAKTNIPDWPAIYLMQDEQLKSLNIADVCFAHGVHKKAITYLAKKYGAAPLLWTLASVKSIKDHSYLPEVIDIFLDASIDVNANIRGKTLLHFPSLLSEKQITKIVELGADVNAVYYTGLTPLHMCVDERPALKQLKILLALGASPLIKSSENVFCELDTDEETKTVLQVALHVRKKCDPKLNADYDEIITILEKYGNDNDRLKNDVVELPKKQRLTSGHLPESAMLKREKQRQYAEDLPRPDDLYKIPPGAIKTFNIVHAVYSHENFSCDHFIWLHKNGYDLRKNTSIGLTLLNFYVLRDCNYKVSKFLIELLDIDINHEYWNKPDSPFLTMLYNHLVDDVTGGDLPRLIDLFLDKGYDLTRNGEVGTILHFPYLLSEDQIKTAIKQGADVNAIKQQYWDSPPETPLSCCVEQRSCVNRLILLLEHGANPLINLQLERKGYKSLLSYTKKEKESGKDEDKAEYGEIITILEKYESDREQLIEAVFSDGDEKIKEFITGGAKVDAGGRFGRTPLMDIIMSGKGNLKHCIKLIKFGADLEAKDIQGNTVLHYAALMKKFDICKYLIENGKFNGAEKNKKGQTPLAAAKLKTFDEFRLYVMRFENKMDLLRWDTSRFIGVPGYPDTVDCGWKEEDFEQYITTKEKTQDSLLNYLDKGKGDEKESVEGPSKRIGLGSMG